MLTEAGDLNAHPRNTSSGINLFQMISKIGLAVEEVGNLYQNKLDMSGKCIN